MLAKAAVLFCLLCLPLFLCAQGDTVTKVPSGTIPALKNTGGDKDSLLLLDDTADSLRSDSSKHIPLYLPLPAHGSISLLEYQPYRRISKRDYQTQNYTELADIIQEHLPGAFPLHLGYYGQNNQLLLFGGSIRDNAVMFNGRPLNDVSLGAFHLQQYPTEFMENAEVLIGADAVILADNSSGFALNLQEPRYNTKNPYTRIWYSQAGYGFISSDGVYSQNISPNTNLTLGYRRLSGSGRYRNQFVDSWNVRGLLRWNINSRTNISLSNIFTNHGNGTNGGVDTTGTEDVNNDLSANVVYPTMEERVFRHDATLSLSSYLAEDSSSAFFATLYATRAQWLRDRDKGLVLHEGDSARQMQFTTMRFGGNARYEQQLWNGMVFRAGGEAEYQRADISVYSEGTKGIHLAAFGHIHYTISEALSLRGGIRPRVERDKIALAFGGALDLRLSQRLQLMADVSLSDRLPTLVEGWQRDREHHLLFIGEIRYQDSLSHYSFLLFTRYVDNPLIAIPRYADSTLQILSTRFRNGDTRSTSGAVISASTMFSAFRVSGFLQTYISTAGDSTVRRLPTLYGGISAQYEYRSGLSLLFTGISLRARTIFDGEQYVPQNWSYISAPIAQNEAFNGIDAYAGAKLGNAFIKLTVQNIFSSSYSTLSTFPQLDRNIRLSVAWTFFD